MSNRKRNWYVRLNFVTKLNDCQFILYGNMGINVRVNKMQGWNDLQNSQILFGDLANDLDLQWFSIEIFMRLMTGLTFWENEVGKEVLVIHFKRTQHPFKEISFFNFGTLMNSRKYLKVASALEVIQGCLLKNESTSTITNVQIAKLIDSPSTLKARLWSNTSQRCKRAWPGLNIEKKRFAPHRSWHYKKDLVIK